MSYDWVVAQNRHFGLKNIVEADRAEQSKWDEQLPGALMQLYGHDADYGA